MSWNNWRLHKHWVTADSINYHLGRSMKGSLLEGAPKEFAALGQMMSAFAALGVWYSLLYVVVEGIVNLAATIHTLTHSLPMISMSRRFVYFATPPFTIKQTRCRQNSWGFWQQEIARHGLRNLIAH